MMVYYIKTTSWNLLESFVSESLSPFSFYGQRDFGNNLSRHSDGISERPNYLILSTKKMKGDYVLKIEDTILDKTCITPVKKSKTLFVYGKTIYYKKGYVSFLFSSRDLLDALVAESQILFEVKCIDKYSSDFVVQTDDAPALSTDKIGYQLSFELQEYIAQDGVFDKLKGLVVAYTQSVAFGSNRQEEEISRMLRELKNAFTSLNTQIMMSESVQPSSYGCRSLIAQCRASFDKTTDRKTNLFDILFQQLSEIDNLSKLRTAELTENKKGNVHRRREILREQIIEQENHLFEIERNSGISEFKYELESIKNKEREIGRAKGKQREYFKKGTTEYERKQFLKEQIAREERDNAEYGNVKNNIAKLTQELSILETGSSQYDGILAALFARVSDITNDLVSKVESKKQAKVEVDYSCITIRKPLALAIKITGCSLAEQDFLNVILNEALTRRERTLSDDAILRLIEQSTNLFKRVESATTNEGMQIVDTLRQFWAYKKNKRTSFEIPDNLKVLKSLMAFFIKPFGFDQMDRYIQNKGIERKEYGFMLRGAFVGYTAMPKTFTDLLYSNENVYTEMDDYLSMMHKQIETQYPCV